jgi:hypothetical protein
VESKIYQTLLEFEKGKEKELSYSSRETAACPPSGVARLRKNPTVQTQTSSPLHGSADGDFAKEMRKPSVMGLLELVSTRLML